MQCRAVQCDDVTKSTCPFWSLMASRLFSEHVLPSHCFHCAAVFAAMSQAVRAKFLDLLARKSFRGSIVFEWDKEVSGLVRLCCTSQSYAIRI